MSIMFLEQVDTPQKSSSSAAATLAAYGDAHSRVRAGTLSMVPKSAARLLPWSVRGSALFCPLLTPELPAAHHASLRLPSAKLLAPDRCPVSGPWGRQAFSILLPKLRGPCRRSAKLGRLLRTCASQRLRGRTAFCGSCAQAHHWRMAWGWCIASGRPLGRPWGWECSEAPRNGASRTCCLQAALTVSDGITLDGFQARAGMSQTFCLS